jgi:heat shock protein HtpX
MQALSRYREFAADRGSAVITGRPSGLASALLKISGVNERIPSQDLREAAQMQAFFIAPVGKQVANLFATHPPLEQRIARLQRLETQLQSGGAGALAAA